MKLIPTGIENFKEMIDKNAYYVDKTNLIEKVLKEKVVLYTRPRRFGKTLNMSMLYYFFSIKEKENAYLFDHLNISKNKAAAAVARVIGARRSCINSMANAVNRGGRCRACRPFPLRRPGICHSGLPEWPATVP